MVEVALLKAARAATVIGIDDLIRQIQSSSAGDDAPASPASAYSYPAPAAAVPPPPHGKHPGKDETAHLKDRWSSLLGVIAETAQLAAPYLKEAEPLRVEGDHVILGFDPEFGEHLKRVDTSRTRLAIEKAIGHELKRSIGVKFVLEDRPQAEADAEAKTEAPLAAKPVATEPKAPKGAAAKRNLAEDPIVKKTMETFGGELFDIRE